VVEAANLSVSLGGKRVLEIPALHVSRSEVLVVMGPNGSGKTTLLLSLASLLKPDKGSSILYGGKPAGDGLNALGARRRFAVVFQESLLLNGTVWDNVTLGARLRGINRAEAGARARKWLERFGVTHLAKRQARMLSGGEAKRVSLARAFVLEPEVLFLDEPFAALDSPTRQGLIDDFERVLRETKVTTLMATHERNEALALADRVAVLIGGAIRQVGTPAEVFSYPVDEEVAEFVEAGNILPGEVAAQDGGLAVVACCGKEIEAVSSLPPGTRVTVCLRHEDVTLSLPSADMPSTSARNRFSGKVTRIYPVGFQVRVTLDCGFPLTAMITGRSREGLALAEGSQVVATFKASSIHLIAHG